MLAISGCLLTRYNRAVFGAFKKDLPVKGLIKACIATAVTVMFTTTPNFAQDLEQELIDRIKPVGEVCIAGQVCRAEETEADTTESVADAVDAEGPASAGETPVAASARSGEDIYNKSCVICHAAGVAGAPKLTDAAAWESRLANGREAVTQNAINGMGGMPPRGTCMDCSDEELDAAVEYMLQGL